MIVDVFNIDLGRNVKRDVPLKQSVPLRVDPLFYVFAKEAIHRDPSLNMRKVTKNIAKKKCIIGELMFNEDFSKDVEKLINIGSVEYNEVMRQVDDMFKKRINP